MDTDFNISMADQKRFSITNTVQQFGNKLFGFIRGKVKSNEDAEDILQDVWFQLSNFSNIDDLENMSAWLYSVARNKVTDKYRKKTIDSLDADIPSISNVDKFRRAFCSIVTERVENETPM